MKSARIFPFLFFVLGTQALASTKTCIGASNNADSAGVILSVELHPDLIVIKTLKGNMLDGDYATNGGKKVVDGKTFLGFEGEDDGYFDEFSVDQDLLTSGTTGLLKVRSTLEGYLDMVYTCVEPTPCLGALL